MKKIYMQIFICLLVASLTLSCEDVSDLAIDRVAAPVVIEFETLTPPAGMVSFKATVFELDKTGILDHTVGIDSLPLANFPIAVYVNESTLLGNYTTDANGEVVMEEEVAQISGASRLEWVGNYKNLDFRIYQGI